MKVAFKRVNCKPLLPQKLATFSQISIEILATFEFYTYLCH